MEMDYKKWTMIIIVVAVAAIVVIAMVTSGPQKTVSPPDTVRQSAEPTAPLVDQDFQKVVPIEQMNLDMTNPVELALQGDKYFEGKFYNQAIEVYKKVLELKPDDIDTINDLGLAYHYTGQSDKAVETLRKGTEVAPAFQRVWLSLGFVLIATGQRDEAVAVLQKAADLDPDSDVGKEALRMLQVKK